MDERLLEEAGFELVTIADVAENEAEVSPLACRAAAACGGVDSTGKRRDLAGLQQFLDAVHRLTREKNIWVASSALSSPERQKG